MGNIIEVWEYNERENCGGRSQEEEMKKGRVGRSNTYIEDGRRRVEDRSRYRRRNEKMCRQPTREAKGTGTALNPITSFDVSFYLIL